MIQQSWNNILRIEMAIPKGGRSRGVRAIVMGSGRERVSHLLEQSLVN